MIFLCVFFSGFFFLVVFREGAGDWEGWFVFLTLIMCSLVFNYLFIYNVYLPFCIVVSCLLI